MDESCAQSHQSNITLSALVAAVAATLLALQSFRRSQQGIETGQYPLLWWETLLTLGSSGIFLYQAVEELAQAEDWVDRLSGRASVTATALNLAAAVIQYAQVQFLRREGKLPDGPVSP